ncbi:hypothetical protein THAOC_12608, partial [Thalassiosira oceanica]
MSSSVGRRKRAPRGSVWSHSNNGASTHSPVTSTTPPTSSGDSTTVGSPSRGSPSKKKAKINSPLGRSSRINFTDPGATEPVAVTVERKGKKSVESSKSPKKGKRPKGSTGSKKKGGNNASGKELINGLRWIAENHDDLKYKHLPSLSITTGSRKVLAVEEHHEHQPRTQLPSQKPNVHLRFRRSSGLADPKSNAFMLPSDPSWAPSPQLVNCGRTRS